MGEHTKREPKRQDTVSKVMMGGWLTGIALRPEITRSNLLQRCPLTGQEKPWETLP